MFCLYSACILSGRLSPPISTRLLLFQGNTALFVFVIFWEPKYDTVEFSNSLMSLVRLEVPISPSALAKTAQLFRGTGFVVPNRTLLFGFRGWTVNVSWSIGRAGVIRSSSSWLCYQWDEKGGHNVFVTGTNKFLLLQWCKKSQIHQLCGCLYTPLNGNSYPLFSFPETEMAGSPTSGIGLPAPNTELGPAPCFSALGPPPPYEETLKTSWLYPELAVECSRTISKERQPMLGKLFDLVEILGDSNLGDLRVWASTSRQKSRWKGVGRWP